MWTPGRVTEVRPSVESSIMTPLIATQWSVRPAQKRENGTYSMMKYPLINRNASSEWAVKGRQYPPACNWARKDSDNYWKRVHLISFRVMNRQVSKEETSAGLEDDQCVRLSLMEPLLMEEGGSKMWVVVCFCLFSSKHQRRERFPQFFNVEENLFHIVSSYVKQMHK